MYKIFRIGRNVVLLFVNRVLSGDMQPTPAMLASRLVALQKRKGGVRPIAVGFLHFVKRDKDKLAAVLVHEIAHVLARHAAERIGRSMLLMAAAHMFVVWLRQRRIHARIQRQKQLTKELHAMEAAVMENPRIQLYPDFSEKRVNLQCELQQLNEAHRTDVQDDEELQKMLMGAAGFLLERPGSRRNEIEADLVGVRLAKLAGYNPDKAPELWDQMAATFKGGYSWASTHPSSKTRSKILVQEVSLLEENNWSEEAMQTVFHKSNDWSA